MSTHFIHRYKHSHDVRRKFFKKLIGNDEAVIVAKFKDGLLVKTVNDKDYRISRRGGLLLYERQIQQRQTQRQYATSNKATLPQSS